MSSKDLPPDDTPPEPAAHDQLKIREAVINHFAIRHDFDTLCEALHERYQFLMAVQSSDVDTHLLQEQACPELVILRRLLCSHKRTSLLNKLFGLIESEGTEKGRRYILLRVAIKYLVQLAQDDEKIAQGKRSDEELLAILQDVLQQKTSSN